LLYCFIFRDHILLELLRFLQCYDNDGYFLITGRIKVLIKVRGFSVAPSELEELLLTHDDIDDVAIVPVPNEESGELPIAFVVLKDGASATETDIQNWVKQRVAPFKRLSGGIVFSSTIPKSSSGKILRRVLRDRLVTES
jgi:4-coumarate--CoA ligase